MGLITTQLPRRNRIDFLSAYVIRDIAAGALALTLLES